MKVLHPIRGSVTVHAAPDHLAKRPWGPDITAAGLQDFPGSGGNAASERIVQQFLRSPLAENRCRSPSGTRCHPKAAVPSTQQRRDLARRIRVGGCAWGSPWNKTNPIEAQQSRLRTNPEVAIGRLGNRLRRTCQIPILCGPGVVRVLRNVTSRIDCEHRAREHPKTNFPNPPASQALTPRVRGPQSFDRPWRIAHLLPSAESGDPNQPALRRNSTAYGRSFVGSSCTRASSC